MKSFSGGELITLETMSIPFDPTSWMKQPSKSFWRRNLLEKLLSRFSNPWSLFTVAHA